jgi:hypothetical protein
MKPVAYSISTQRLDRLLLWSRLSLLRLAQWIVQHAGAWAPLERALTTMIAPRLAKLEKIISALIVFKAAAHAKPLARQKHYDPAGKRRLTPRQIFGVRLRKLAKAKDPRAKIAALLALLETAEAESRRFARRMSKGLNRRRGGILQSAFNALVVPHLLAAYARFDRSDTS